MKVEFIKYHPMFAHSIGDVCELTDGDTKSLLESGHVVSAKVADHKKTTNESNSKKSNPRK